MTRKEQLLKRQEEIKNQLKAIEAREKTAERKNRTRRLILLGTEYERLLSSGENISREILQKFLDSLTKKTEEKTHYQVGDTCPECGGEIVQRVNKAGKSFLGCSKYPACEFSADAE